jgi:phospho-N-acetylmuramoyl-pentapeptide-transferase
MRDLAALLVAFLLSWGLGPSILHRLRRLKGQQISEDAPERHKTKQGTPTMGGVLILAGFFPAALLVGGLAVVPVLLVALALGFVGGLDDYLSMKRGKNLGLKARQKMALQILVAVAFAFWLKRAGHPLAIWLPGGALLDLGWGYLVVAAIWIVGMSNAVNLADGLDGLCGGLSAIAGVALGVALERVVIPGGVSQGSSIAAFALAGGCLGFLWYNAHPAQVFMGDTGSLALGGGLAALSLAGSVEIPAVLIFAVFLAETLSVMIQVASFKTRGKRVFRMSPIHHHFELIGWAETQVVQRFWILGALFAALGAAWALNR